MNNPEEMSKVMTPHLPLWSYQLQQNSKLAVKTRKDLEVHLITRALKDEEFKQELMANPKAVVKQELGTKLPDDIEYNVIEETETALYIVLPSNPYEGLTEPELQALLGLTLEDVALWVFEQQRNTMLDEASSVAMISRAWKDEAFKQELLSNPKVTLANKLGILTPDSFDIQVVSENSNSLYLVLPSESHLFAKHKYLSNIEMETVAHAEGKLVLVAGSPDETDLTNCTNSSSTRVCP
jgi:hypothetical protein